MSKKPSVPKGTRDFSPQEVAKRSYIMETIKSSFQLYGFQPIETPSFENSETLMGKYGEEGDRLIFKILNSGDYFDKLEEEFNFYHKFSGIVNAEFEKIKTSCEVLDVKLDEYELKLQIENIIDRNNRKYHNESVNKHLITARNLYNKFIRDRDIKKIIIDILYDRIYKEIVTDFITGLAFSYYKTIYLTNKITPKISEKALRYDLTVPFARYVVQHQNEITFPFKRYQMQPVWRADRPQKGRFREFWQCDADVVGSDSLWQEIELVQLYDDVFTKLQLSEITIKINNRKILSGIAEVIGAEDKLIDFTVALDKLDKIGEEGVKNEMLQKGISNKALEKLQPLFSFTGSNTDKLNSLSQLLATSETGRKGIEEVQFVINTIQNLGLKASEIELDVTLARGLNYYTGAIFEVSAPEKVQMGSIGGGGRYDDLTGIFGLKDVSGVGISFGLDRIFLVLEELGLFPKTVEENTKVLFINFGEAEALYAMQAITALRKNNIASELYPDGIKMGKQMMYADKRNIPYVVIAGGDEMESETFTLKNLKTGEQEVVKMDRLLEILKD